ncbi:MAG: aminopeptidase N, partial [Propionibacteriaceae bacterium]
IWTTFEPDDARVAYACFDQPDLKAVFGIEVTAPPEWTVVSNSGAAEVTEVDGSSHWQFADTPLLSTYLPVVNAGPFHQVRSERGGYDLGLYARASLAPMLDRDAEELFDLTATGLKFYGEQFQLPFPQTRYDQIFVPEYGGAMENYGCVTWSDAFVYRDEPSYAERELRAVVLLHEMAHMWFGDMVTMRWWDDLWLNESFADWACAWCATAVTEFGDVWAGNLASDKLRAYAADAAPTTHPIRQPIPDTEAASASFDAITYPKGAAVLKQLVAYVGEDNFVAALAAYFRRYAWQNTTLQDLIHELELTSGLDLSAWVTGWLESSGTDRLTLRRDGRALALTATSPSHRPPLPHQLEVGVYSGGGDTLVRQQTIGVRVGGEVTELPEVDEDALLVVNDNDLTFASVRPDDASLQLLLEHGGRLPTALARTLAVTTSHDLLFNGELSADAFVTCVLNVLPNETADSVIEPLLSLAVNVADYWSPAERRPALLSRLADLSISLADSPARRLAAVRALARTASTPEQLSELATRADAPDLGWRRLTRLAELGQLDEAEVAEHLAADPNPEAWVSAEVCRSAQADPAAKQRAWDVTVVERKLPVDRVSRLGLAFWRRGQDEVLAPFRQAYLDVLPELGHSGMTWTLALTGSIFPQADTDDDFPARLVSAATAPGVSYLVGKRVLERTDTLRRMLVTRSLA